MKGFIGCNADLSVGAVIVTGKNLELRMVIVGPATEEQARESAESMGAGPLVVEPGERFYEVEVTTLPIGSLN
jgi:hypothetical protein